MADKDDTSRIRFGGFFENVRKAFGFGSAAAIPADVLPPWATIEVRRSDPDAREPAAGGPFQAHEEQTLSSLPVRRDTPARTQLNLHFIAGPGLPELKRMLAEGRYRVLLPEEGALLAAAWLIRQGESDRSARLISTLAPYFDRLRFYPVPHAQPLPEGSGVSLHTVGEAVASLRAKRPQPHVERMREALAIWSPLYDRTVAMFMETVEGEPPSLQRTPAGIPARGPRGAFIVIGGWPCKRYPADWRERANMLLDEYKTLRTRHRLCKKPDDPKENFARLRAYLATCAADPKRMREGDVRAIRTILATIVARHGDPDSVRRLATRTAQRHVAARATHVALANTLADRLEQHPKYTGLATLDRVLTGLSESRPLPRSLVEKALRCLEAPLPQLAQRGVLPSSEALAALLPWLSARTRAAAVTDSELRRLLETSYLAYRRRRTQLLEVERPVPFGELPWIQELAPWVGSDDASRSAARASLTQVATVAIGSFPQTVLPNQLVQELRAQAASAGIELPLVELLSAETYRGALPAEFLPAARAAARMLRGSLYERYYGVPYDRVLELENGEALAELCAELAGVSPKTERSAVHEATILEQAQILTTHNLAVLFQELELAGNLDLAQLSRRCWVWLCRRQLQRKSHWRAQRDYLKHAGYALRQLVFFLSCTPPEAQRAFVDFAAEHLGKQRSEVSTRLEPVLFGLRACVGGQPFDASGLHAASGGRRLLAWSVRSHWLLSRTPKHSNWPRAGK